MVHLILKNYRMNLVTNTILFILLANILLEINLAFSSAFQKNAINSYIQQYPENTYYLSGAVSYYTGNNSSGSIENLLQELKNIEGVKEIGYNIQNQLILNKAGQSDKKITTVYLNDAMQKIVYSLKKGTWFSKYPYRDEVIIGGKIAKKYKVNQMIEVKTESGQLRKMKVIGILQEPERVMLLDWMGERGTYQDSMVFRENIILTVDDSLVLGKSEIFSPCSLVIMLQKNVNKQTIQSLIQYGNLISFDEMKKNSREETKQEYQHIISIQVLYVCIVILGMVSAMFIYSKNNRQLFSIYQLLGMQKKQFYQIEFGEISFTILFSIFVVIISFIGLPNIHIITAYKWTKINSFVTLIYGCFLELCGFGFTRYFLKKDEL